MPTLTQDQLKEAVALYDRYGSIKKCSEMLGVERATFRYRLNKARLEEVENLSFPEMPSGQVPAEKLIERMCDDFERRHTAFKAKKWFPITVNTNIPMGICWFGDPHVDDNGCNWPLLKKHIDICNKTEGMYGANIGDSHNNWVGRLSRLYAEQETSRETALQLVEWLFRDSGVDWLILLKGNHDMWSGSGDPLDYIARGMTTPLEDWQAQFKLVFPNGREGKFWAAHDFKGHSMYHDLHGPLKKARMSEAAHLYICGHKHNWSLMQDEDPERGFVFWLARARGYKFIDKHAEVHGFASDNEGAAIVSVINPHSATEAGFIQCFSDVEHAADYLTFLRKKY